MTPIDKVVLILALSFPIAVLSLAAAFWFIFKSSEKHLLLVLDRFLSRNMSEYGMTDLVKREIEADQQGEETDEDREEQILEEYLRNRQSAAEMVGVVE